MPGLLIKDRFIQEVDKARSRGWIMEPAAKGLLREAGMDCPDFVWARDLDDALEFARHRGFPLVAKVVSPVAMHKSDVGGVITGINSIQELKDAYSTLSRIDGFSGVLVEEVLQGIELILGAKIDFQFGPVIILGMGGVAVEIYNDTTIRMAPLRESDVNSMIQDLRGRPLLEGYRGKQPVNIDALGKAVVRFSRFVIDIQGYMESIDINPLICNSKRCVVADARIILKKE